MRREDGVTLPVLRLVLIAAIALGFAQPATAQYLSPEDAKALSDIAPYLEVVGGYRQREFAQAAQLLLDWSPANVTKAVEAMCTLTRRLASPSRSRDDLDVADVEAAVLLHSDAALRAWQERKTELVTFHVNTAIRIVAWLHAALDAPGFTSDRINPSIRRLSHRNWFLAMAQTLTGLMEPSSSLRLLKLALERFPADAQFLCASGSAREGLAQVTELRLRLRRIASSREQLAAAADAARVEELRRAAERDYRRVLKLDPGCDEARLRLGRVLAQTGRNREAEKELRALLSSTDNVYLRYMGSLFLGRVLDSGRRLGEAAELYREAIRLQPECQACRVALAHALDRLGDQQQAEAVLMQFLRGTQPKDEATDPWWVYPYGQREAGERLFDTLRTAVLTK
jgi:tetratricopeptide (TPR) repeat protein